MIESTVSPKQGYMERTLTIKKYDKILVLLGRRGSGKTTLAQLLKKSYFFQHIEMSSELKKMRKHEKQERIRLRKFVDSYRKKGQISLLIKRVIEQIPQKSNRLVITGIRHLEEIDFLTKLSDGTILHTVYLDSKFFVRLSRILNRSCRNNCIEFIIEEYFSKRWGDSILRKRSALIINNIDINRSIEEIDREIKNERCKVL
jgi:adenylate kinase family enzyme